MTSIAARYQIRLKDQGGTVVAIFDNFSSLEVIRKVNDIGQCALEFEDDDDSRFALFELDGQVEVWRAVPGSSLDWYLEFEGLHRRAIRETNSAGERFFRSIGHCYNDLLARRVVAYRHGTVLAWKNDYAEDCMKEHVNENCGPGANNAERIRNGVMTNFTVEAESAQHDQTPVWEKDSGFENLLDVLKAISAFSIGEVPASRAVDFAVVGNGAGAFVFNTYLDQLGTDRTLGTGSDPVLFSLARGNLQDFTYDLDRSQEVNAVIVMGRGEASTQTVIARENAAAGAESDWNDIEVARGASENEFEVQLEKFGDSVLEENQYKEAFIGTPMQIASALYGSHYTLGDKVTLRYGATEVDKKIIGVTIRVRDGKEEVSLEFEDVPRP